MIKFIEVKDKALLEKVFAFRFKVLDERDATRAAITDYASGLDRDKYDDYSDHFAAFDNSGEVIACVRLIHHSPIGYPAVNNMKTDIDLTRFDADKVAELSRIFIAKQLRNLRDTKALIEGLKAVGYAKMAALGIEYTYGGLEKAFLRLLNIYKLPYKAIGAEQEYLGWRYPCLMYTRELEEQNPQLLEWRETA